MLHGAVSTYGRLVETVVRNSARDGLRRAEIVLDVVSIRRVPLLV